MKIYKWIDKYNEIICNKITIKYVHNLNSGKPTTYFYHTTFWGKYLLRLFLVLVSLILIKKSAYKTFIEIFKYKNSAFYSPKELSIFKIKFLDFIATLFGYRYFVSKDILPLLSDNQILQRQIIFTKVEKPLVSIIIPVYNHLDYTYNCLKSIKDQVSNKFSYEIIIVDDSSKDKTEEFCSHNVIGINYIRNENNLGFILSCNKGSEASRGKFILFLNNDVQVCSNWLESLVETVQQDNIGCVGSKLIYANGLLQEAGGIVFSDASAANYGRFNSPQHPSYNYINTVDYCSGASIIVSKQDFELLGNFDTRYIPAYYEDTDLCFGIRHKLNKKVVYQPLSQLIHFEGISSGTDIDKDPIKGFQKVNKIKFSEKWANELKQYVKSGEIINGINKYISAKTVLIIDDVIPAPDRDSGSLRLSQILNIVKSLGYHVVFVPNDSNKRTGYFENLVLSGIEVLYRFPNRNAMIKILSNKMPNIDYVWICKPHNNKPFEFLFSINPKAKRIYDTIDLHFLRQQREAELTKDLTLLATADNTKLEELHFAKKADITIAISIDEKVVLNDEGINNVIVIPNIHSQEFSDSKFLKFSKREGLIFIGGYAHKPNVDAVIWLIKEIMPIVWKTNPEIKVTLLGSYPTKEVLDLQCNNVLVPGYLEDVSSYFFASRVFVAPLRFGAGMKGKIGQSLSFALPVVTTTIGSEGIGLINEKDYLLATTANEFAEQILRLYTDSQLWEQISNSSKELIEKYNPSNIRNIIGSFLPDLIHP